MHFDALLMGNAHIRSVNVNVHVQSVNEYLKSVNYTYELWNSLLNKW